MDENRPHVSRHKKMKRLVSGSRLIFPVLRAFDTVGIRIPMAVLLEVLFLLAESFRMVKSLVISTFRHVL